MRNSTSSEIDDTAVAQRRVDAADFQTESQHAQQFLTELTSNWADLDRSGRVMRMRAAFHILERLLDLNEIQVRLETESDRLCPDCGPTNQLQCPHCEKTTIARCPDCGLCDRERETTNTGRTETYCSVCKHTFDE